MNNIKRLSLALVALGLSAPAFADSTVLVPSQHGGFKVGIDALYLRPSNSDLNYATVVLPPDGFFTAGSQRNSFVDPAYDWGFYAQIGYLFPCTGNDLTLGYTYLRSDETDSVIAGSGATIAVVPFLGAIFPGGSATGKSEFDLNVADLEGGQRFTTGSYDMRMFAGLRYANIDHELQTHVQSTGVGGPIGSQEFKSQFRGLGPRLGVDGRYCLSIGFGNDANLSTALLVSHVDAHYDRTFQLTPSLSVARFQARNGSENRLVPVLEAKLGVDYTYIMDCRCKSALAFEAGYQATNYFNAVDHSRVLNLGGTAFDHQNTTTDIGFDGIYFGLKYYA